jgi:hypothetical protein
MNDLDNQAKNLMVISEAMDRHDKNCGEPLLEVQLNPFEYERLGWDEIRGVPIVENGDLGTGVFRLICSGIHTEDEEEVEESVDVDSNKHLERQEERELVYV